MDTFLAPIEKPAGLQLKLIYYFVKKKFGKVLTPIKVFSSRLPVAFSNFASSISKLDTKLQLPAETANLIRTRVAQINTCSFCIDAARYESIQKFINVEKFDALSHYRDCPLFTKAEQAVLDYAGELTRERKVQPDTFTQLTKYFTEREICEIVYLVATEHFYNITNIGLNIHSDMLCKVPLPSNAHLIS